MNLGEETEHRCEIRVPNVAKFAFLRKFGASEFQSDLLRTNGIITKNCLIIKERQPTTGGQSNEASDRRLDRMLGTNLR